MKKLFVILSLVFGFVLTQSCDKDDADDDDANTNTALKIETTEVTDITSSAATLHGNLIEGSLDGLEKGFVYGRFADPGFDDNREVVAGSALGEFSLDLSGLPTNSQYYVKAYAINKSDTAFGEEVDFKTDF